MPYGHYFETEEPLEADQVERIMNLSGIDIKEYRDPIPKVYGVVLTPYTIRNHWEYMSGQNRCQGKCRDEDRKHAKWDDLSAQQQEQFTQEVVRQMNNSMLGRDAEEFVIENPFFSDVALRPCGTAENTTSR